MRMCLIGPGNIMLDDDYTGDPDALGDGESLVYAPINWGEPEAFYWLDGAGWQVPKTWEDIRLQRDILLDACLWTLDPATPLTSDCQAAYLAYRKTLHKVTFDYATPADVIWPVAPELAYDDS